MVRWRWWMVVASAMAVATGCACRADSAAEPAAPTGPAGPPEAAAGPFLTAWQGRDVTGAARLTTEPDRAGRALMALAADLGYTDLRLTPGTPAPVGTAPGPAAATPGTVPGGVAMVVPFTVTMTFAAGSWTYDSSLAVVAVGDQWRVQWAPTVVHPQLRAGDSLAVGPVKGAALGPPTDRDGQPLTAADHPSLARLLGNATLTRGTGTTPGTDGTAVLRVANGQRTPLQVLSAPGAPAGRRTTFAAGAQSAAQQAVDAAPGTTAGVVVLQAGTGHILAMATKNPGRSSNVATDRGSPPGSTMKVVSAAALLARDYRPGTVVPCPEAYGNIRNSHVTPDPGATLEQDLAVSCNTAFAREGVAHLTGDELARAAGTFGLTTPWDIGLGDPTPYLVMPPVGADQSELANQLIGQGRLLASPLAMASVAATVATGAFHQPVLVDDAPRVRAAGLSPRAAADLRQMMQAVVSRGTARSLRPVGGPVGAKTGTAEGPGGTNGWMIAFRGDVAVACLVTGIGSADGDTSAGPVVAQVLRSL